MYLLVIECDLPGNSPVFPSKEQIFLSKNELLISYFTLFN